MGHAKIINVLCCLMTATHSMGTASRYTTAWNELLPNSPQATYCLDFSYAEGYHVAFHCSKEAFSDSHLSIMWDYGASPSTMGKSDRLALKTILSKIDKKPNARAIIYFPEGEHLHTGRWDDIIGQQNGTEKSLNVSTSLWDRVIKERC